MGDLTKKPASLRAAALLWAISAALCIEWQFEIAWWHPYCDAPSDGPAYNAYGLPLPFRQFSGISSMKFNAMPHVYLLDIALLAAASYPIFLFLLCGLSRRWPAARTWAMWSGLMVFLVLAASQAVVAKLTWWPVRTIASDRLGYADDTYVAYRPAMLATGQGKRSCEAWRY
jgi:hypothetical protein